jgi:uncharacterized protein (TIGR02001 family)
MRRPMFRPALAIPLGLLALAWAPEALAADLSAELGVTSDYRYRGLSLSDGRPAAQASVTLEHGSGLYLDGWGSTIRGEDSGPGVEIDLAAGYTVELSDALGLDLSGTYFLYPSDGSANYFEATAIATLERGPASASFGVSLVPRQKATRDEAGRARPNSYFFAGLGYRPEATPVTLSARLGRERGAFDEVGNGGKWDWTIGADIEIRTVTLSLAYVGSSIAERHGRHGLTGSLLVHF